MLARDVGKSFHLHILWIHQLSVSKPLLEYHVIDEVEVPRQRLAVNTFIVSIFVQVSTFSVLDRVLHQLFKVFSPSLKNSSLF